MLTGVAQWSSLFDRSPRHVRLVAMTSSWRASWWSGAGLLETIGRGSLLAVGLEAAVPLCVFHNPQSSYQIHGYITVSVRIGRGLNGLFRSEICLI